MSVVWVGLFCHHKIRSFHNSIRTSDSCPGVNVVSFAAYVELIVIPLTRVNLPAFESCYKITVSVVLTPVMGRVPIESTEAWLL